MSSIALVGFDDEAWPVQAQARLKEQEHFLVHASSKLDISALTALSQAVETVV